MQSEQVSVRVEATLAFPAIKVWEAWAAPELWWVREAKVRLAAGGEYHVHHPRGWLRGVVTGVEEGRRLRMMFPFKSRNVAFETDFTVTLEPADGKTRVAIEHVGPPIMAWMGDMRQIRQGWRDTLVKLSNYLRGIA